MSWFPDRENMWINECHVCYFYVYCKPYIINGQRGTRYHQQNIIIVNFYLYFSQIPCLITCFLVKPNEMNTKFTASLTNTEQKHWDESSSSILRKRGMEIYLLANTLSVHWLKCWESYILIDVNRLIALLQLLQRTEVNNSMLKCLLKIGPYLTSGISTNKIHVLGFSTAKCKYALSPSLLDHKNNTFTNVWALQPWSNRKGICDIFLFMTSSKCCVWGVAWDSVSQAICWYVLYFRGELVLVGMILLKSMAILWLYQAKP